MIDDYIIEPKRWLARRQMFLALAPDNIHYDEKFFA
jgi:hypothetical protein